jgi:hypothetical protein
MLNSGTKPPAGMIDIASAGFEDFVSAWRGLLSLRDPAALSGRRGHPG